MPNDDAARARAEQEENNAHQGNNDARQNRNDTAQQANVNEEQVRTNQDQGDTNTAQGITNADQGITNSAIRETIKLLGWSVDANTASMEAVSKALEENLKLYTKIDVRLTDAENKTNETARRAAEIEAKSDKRASTYRRLWGTLAVAVLVVGVGGFGLNAYRTRQLCNQRNLANASNTLLVQEDVAMLLAKDPTNAALPGLQRYLTRSVQVDCSGFL